MFISDFSTLPADSITPWDPTQQEPEAGQYDLRISELFTLDENESGYIGINVRTTPRVFPVVPNGRPTAFMLHPYTSALMRTLESVTPPPNMIGIIHPRTTTFRCGLLMSFGDVPHGYSGQLTFGLFLMAKRPMLIDRYARIASIRFAQTTPPARPYSGVWQGGAISSDGEPIRPY